ncbi:MAG: hypothetical protein EBX41_02535 [Chitinophagia bacterium]|nr:hypothetical protein [Chitinophagia bacterium]
MWKYILLIVGPYLIYNGILKLSSNTAPATCTLAEYERNADAYKQYDYFVLSKGYYSGLYYYEYDRKSPNTMNEVLFALVSDSLVNDMVDKYYDDSTAQESTDFSAYFNAHIKPKVFLKSGRGDLSKSAVSTILDDTAAINTSGMRVKSFDDFSDEVKKLMSKDGHTSDNTLVIVEGKTPGDFKRQGWMLVGAGIAALLLGLFFIFKHKILK